MTTLANTTPAWPTVVDDDGTGQTGTPLDVTAITAIRDTIDSLTHTSSNSTITPGNIIDEVVTARGNKASLTARLDGVIDADGALITPASVVSASQLQAQSGSAINLVKNSTFFIWDRGLALAPAYWTLATGTIAISGTGQADTTRYVGKYCAKLTWSSGTATLTQIVLDATDFANLDHYKVETKIFGFGCWIKASIASHARLSLNDGNTTTETSYHTGAGGWEWISGTHTFSSAATTLTIACQVASSGSAYFSGLVVNSADVAPPLWFPEPKIRGSAVLDVSNTLTTGDGKKYISFARPIRLDHIQGMVLTDPVGAAITMDFEKFEPTTTWTSMGTAGALIDDGDGVGQWLLTTTAADFDHRCLSGWFGASGELSATGQENKIARLNIDQVGSGTAGSDLFLRIDGVQCMHPFEDQYAYDDLGI